MALRPKRIVQMHRMALHVQVAYGNTVTAYCQQCCAGSFELLFFPQSSQLAARKVMNITAFARDVLAGGVTNAPLLG